MNKEYKCPYCGQDSYAKTNKGKFLNWDAIRRHTSTCKNNTKEYYIDLNYGPIHYLELSNKDYFYIHSIYPNLSTRLADIRKIFQKKGIEIGTSKRKWDKDSIIKAIQRFSEENNKIPQHRDWETNNSISGYPSNATVKNYFGSWNKGIEAAGFKANYNDGHGVRNKAKDGILYRSQYETNFVNKFLYKQYKYSYETEYPEEYMPKYYDWYLPDLDLYIELDGGLRPEIIKEKIEINKKLGRKLLVVKPNDISKLQKLIEFDRK